MEQLSSAVVGSPTLTTRRTPPVPGECRRTPDTPRRRGLHPHAIKTAASELSSNFRH